MGYNEALAGRMRAALAGEAGVSEKAMFGGLCFFVHGNMACGVCTGDRVVVRVGRDAWPREVARAHASPMTFTGKSLKTMVYVSAAGVASSKAFTAWMMRGVAFARTLPKKEAKKGKKKMGAVACSVVKDEGEAACGHGGKRRGAEGAAGAHARKRRRSTRTRK